LDESQEAPQEGDTGDVEEQTDDDQAPAPEGDNAALALQMVAKMAGKDFGKALKPGDGHEITRLDGATGGAMHTGGVGTPGTLSGDAFGSVIPDIWRLEG
jgi:hypothetical protein